MQEDAKAIAEGASATRVPAPEEVTHRCPPVGSGVMPCCDRTPFEVPLTDRMTEDPALVTCGGVPQTRECEGCGERKPIDEMATVRVPGTWETFQCSDCRGGP